MLRISNFWTALVIGSVLTAGVAFAQTPAPSKPMSLEEKMKAHAVHEKQEADCKKQAKEKGLHVWNRGKFMKSCMGK
jgi:hypothetical protein